MTQCGILAGCDYDSDKINEKMLLQLALNLSIIVRQHLQFFARRANYFCSSESLAQKSVCVCVCLWPIIFL